MSDGAIEATAHGAGENFPLDDTGEQLDSAPVDNKPDPIDRRVELFFFDPEFGITPPAAGAEFEGRQHGVPHVAKTRFGDHRAPRR